MSDDEHDASEAQRKMEEDRQRRKEKADEEFREYEDVRRDEREREQQEIQELKERREQRKKEREEIEKRLAETRAIEEQKRRAEEEERQRVKKEEEARKRAEREKKRAEFEARSKISTGRNFVISKKSGGREEAEEKKQEVTKSKEQLEAEKRAVLEQRVPPLNIDGFKADQLRAKAKELHELIYRLEGDRYDLEQRFTHQTYDMQELAERARKMTRGSNKGRKTQTEPDALAAKLSGIPPKIVMYSEYEKVTDHRKYNERKTVFQGPMYGTEYVKIAPTTKVVMTETGFKVDENPDAAGGAPAEAAEAAEEE